MWALENRPKYNRDHLRYPSDLTDDEWAYVEPLIPPAKPGGGKRRTDMRGVMNGVMYILSTGCQWRYLPRDFPPYSTAYRHDSSTMTRSMWNMTGLADYSSVSAWSVAPPSYSIDVIDATTPRLWQPSPGVP